MVYEQNLPLLYSCLLCSVVFASLFLPLTIAFLIAFNQNNSLNRQTANAKKLTKAGDRNPPSTAHTLTSVSKRSGQLHWLLEAKWRTCNSLFGFELQTRPYSTLRKKEEKTKFWGRLVESVVFQKTVIGSTFDYGIESKSIIRFDIWRISMWYTENI